MVRSLALALAMLLLPVAALADGGAARDAATSRPLPAVATRLAESGSQCRAKCERLRSGCTGSQCRAAYAACIASCR